MSKKPVRVAVTGAAGQIGYALLFRIASGEMLGKDQPVILQLLEIPDEKAQKALKGVMMELDDCAFPLLAGMEAHGDPMTAFKDADYDKAIGVVVLTGAGALLQGFPELLTETTGIPTHLADNPESCVAIGTGKILESVDMVKNSLLAMQRV